MPEDIHFKTQPAPVAKNATPRPPAGNQTSDPGSLDQRSTDWATETVAVSLGMSSVYIYTEHIPGIFSIVMIKPFAS